MSVYYPGIPKTLYAILIVRNTNHERQLKLVRIDILKEGCHIRKGWMLVLGYIRIAVYSEDKHFKQENNEPFIGFGSGL